MIRLLWMAFIYVMLCCVEALAGGSFGGLSEGEVPEAVKRRLSVYQAIGVTVKGYAKGPGNLIAAVVNVPEGVVRRVKGLEMFAKGGDAIFYISPDGRQMVVGFVFDLENGRELSTELLNMYADAQTQAGEGGKKNLSEATFEELQQLYGVATRGRDGSEPALYCFVDLRCPYSIKQYEALKGKESVKWIPLTFGDPVSTTRASLLLAFDNPGADELEKAIKEEAKLKEVFWKFDEETKKALARGVMRLEHNVGFAVSHGIKTTPVCVLVQDGRVGRVFKGVFDADFIRNNSR